MKCLSLYQPWATLLVAGYKRVETRSWPLHHRGPLLIHAAKKWTPELGEACAGFPVRQALEKAGIVFEPSMAACQRGWNLPFGAIVGRVDVTGCTRVEDCEEVLTAARLTNSGVVGINSIERMLGDLSDGRYAILCENAVRFGKPIPYRGEPSVFDVPDGILEQLETR